MNAQAHGLSSSMDGRRISFVQAFEAWRENVIARHLVSVELARSQFEAALCGLSQNPFSPAWVNAVREECARTGAPPMDFLIATARGSQPLTQAMVSITNAAAMDPEFAEASLIIRNTIGDYTYHWSRLFQAVAFKRRMVGEIGLQREMAPYAKQLVRQLPDFGVAVAAFPPLDCNGQPAIHPSMFAVDSLFMTLDRQVNAIVTRDRVDIGGALIAQAYPMLQPRDTRPEGMS